MENNWDLHDLSLLKTKLFSWGIILAHIFSKVLRNIYSNEHPINKLFY